MGGAFLVRHGTVSVDLLLVSFVGMLVSLLFACLVGLNGRLAELEPPKTCY